MNYHCSTPSECDTCVQRLCENSDEILDFLFEKRGSGCRLFDSGDRTTTVCLFVLKRLLTSLRADIAKVLSDPSSSESKLIQLLCLAGESQADVLRRYERSRRDDSRAVGRNGTSSASGGTYRISNYNQATWRHKRGQRYDSHGKAQPSISIPLPTHGRGNANNCSISPSDDGFLSDEGAARAISAVKSHQSEPTGQPMDRSTQVTPVVDNTDEKATYTEEAVVTKMDECCGSPLQTRNSGNQACMAVSTRDAEASTEEGDLYTFFGGGNIAASGVSTKDSALQVCLSAETMLSCHFANNDSSSTDFSTTQGNSSDLSAGQIPFAKAATHLIRTDCGLLVFNADGSLLAEELWRRGNDNSDIYRAPSQSTYSKASGVKVMECEDGDAGTSGVEASLPSRLNFFYHPNNASGRSGMWPEAGTGTEAPVQERRQPSVCSSVGTPVLLAKEITIVSSSADLPPPTATRTAAAGHEGTARRVQSAETSIEEIFGDMKIGGVDSPKSSTVSTGSAIIAAEEEEEESTLNQVSPLPYG